MSHSKNRQLQENLSLRPQHNKPSSWRKGAELNELSNLVLGRGRQRNYYVTHRVSSNETLMDSSLTQDQFFLCLSDTLFTRMQIGITKQIRSADRQINLKTVDSFSIILVFFNSPTLRLRECMFRNKTARVSK